MAAQKLQFCNDSHIMMDKRRITTLNKAGIYTDIDFLYDTPYKYFNLTNKTALNPGCNGAFVFVSGVCKKVTSKVCKNGSVMVKAELESFDDKNNPIKINVSFFRGKNYVEALKPLIDQKCVVAGNVQFLYQAYWISEPILFELERLHCRNFVSVYTKRKGISSEWMNASRKIAMENMSLTETIPEYVQNTCHIPSRKEALKQLHTPTDERKLMGAVKRQVVEDILYFACAKERVKIESGETSPYVIRTLEKTLEVKEMFPYDLTADQKNVLNSLTAQMKQGKRISALIQGDVGCGKSICAFLLMIAMAENGYQSVLMAPTTILAKQHYEELKSYAEKVGFQVAYLASSVTPAQKKKTLEAIANNEIMLIVGTHAAVAEGVTFPNLGLAVIDEEHRFGAKTREALIRNKCHSINFSATPIPRSVAQTIFSDRELFEIKTMPGNRKPVATSVVQTVDDALKMVKEELNKGNQAYIVCPYVGGVDEEESEETAKSHATVVDTAEYCKKMLGVPVGIATGGADTKAQVKELEETLNSFKSGDLKVLCATTVIEVGVNVPDATVMVVLDAFRFGLAQLHQLRGRVGRGSKEGYCVLVSDKDTNRLHHLEETNDGFKIAQMDYEERGGGDIIGTQQSGTNRFLVESLSYPKWYKFLQPIAEQMVKNGEDIPLIEEMEKRSEKIYVKSNKIKMFKSHE